MTILIGVLLIVLGLAVGFVVAYAVGAGSSMNLFVGLLLFTAGGVVGFVIEWLIDEAYRKNRELRRQLSLGVSGVPTGEIVVQAGADTTSEALADFLRDRDTQISDLRAQLEEADSRLDHLQGDFEVYQQTHPDNLAVIKGIGSVYQWKLRDAGVHTFAHLASSDANQLRRMLDIKDWQQVDIESWIQQARDWAQREA